MAVARIELTDAEKELLQRIQFDPLKIAGGIEEVDAVCYAARELALSLLKRKAIPEHRIQFFSDPEYNVSGHGSSREQILKRNFRGEDVLKSVHFLEHLRYFIYGPSLPDTVIECFGQAVKNRGMITSGDIIPLGDTAKQPTRRHGLETSRAAEEFYKLALNTGSKSTKPA